MIHPHEPGQRVYESLEKHYKNASVQDRISERFDGEDRAALIDDLLQLAIAEREEFMNDLRAWQGRTQLLATLVPVVMAYAASGMGDSRTALVLGAVSIVAGLLTIAVGFHVVVVGVDKKGLQIHAILDDLLEAEVPAAEVRLGWIVTMAIANSHLSRQARTTYHQTIAAGVLVMTALVTAGLSWWA